MPGELAKMYSDVLSVEVNVLRSHAKPLAAIANSSEAARLANLLVGGQYWSILTDDLAARLIGTQWNGTDICGETLHEHIQANVSEYLANAGVNNEEARLISVLVGAAALNVFVQTNWTGPKNVLVNPEDSSSGVADLFALLPYGLIETTEADLADDEVASHHLAKDDPAYKRRGFNSSVQKFLGVDGEESYQLCGNQHLLLIALAVLSVCVESSSTSVVTSAHWWYARAVFKHQQILSDWSVTLRTKYFKCMENTMNTFVKSVSTDVLLHMKVRASIEMANVSHFYQDHKAERACITEARDTAGVKLELTGAMGKRTRWQQFDVSQLVLNASGGLNDYDTDSDDAYESVEARLEADLASQENDTEVTERSLAQVPKKLDLNDDTLLESIEFTEGDVHKVDGQTPGLSVLTQCLLLASCLNVKNSNAKDGLTTEEMIPFIDRLLKECTKHNWQVYSMALLLRSRLEGERHRTAERGLMQMQVLVDQFNDAAGQKEASPGVRMAHIYTIYYPSHFELEREIGIYYLRLGISMTAREIFERLHMWEDVVDCYRATEEFEKATALAAELVEKNPTPRRLCLLGDVSNDPKHYERAWEVSGGRYSKAMRALGRIYFAQNNFEKCVECLKLASAINPLVEGVWFTLGAAAIRIGEWESGIQAYRHCVVLNDTNGESWNNLGTCYIRENNIEKAASALKHAVKHSYDNWKIWENYFNVALQLEQASECMRAIARLLDLKGNKFTDVKAIQYVNTAMMARITEIGDTHEARTLSKRWQETLGRVQVGGLSQNPSLWVISAEWHKFNNNDDKVLDCLQRAYRSSQKPGWQESTELASNVVQSALNVYAVYEQKDDARSYHSGLLMLRGLAKKTQDVELTANLKAQLEAAVEKCTSKKESSR
eukprot:CFRG2911T1